MANLGQFDEAFYQKILWDKVYGIDPYWRKWHKLLLERLVALHDESAANPSGTTIYDQIKELQQGQYDYAKAKKLWDKDVQALLKHMKQLQNEIFAQVQAYWAREVENITQELHNIGLALNDLEEQHKQEEEKLN